MGVGEQGSVDAGAGDQFVAADQRGDGRARGDRAGSVHDDATQEFGSAPSGVGEVDMRVGLVHRHRIDRSEHFCGEDAMQVERGHDRGVQSHVFARALEQPSLGVELVLGGHRAVHRPNDGVYTRRACAVDRLDNRAGQGMPVSGGERAGRGCARGDQGDHFSEGVQGWQGAPEHRVGFGPGGVDQLRAAPDVEIGQGRGHGVERTHLLGAFDDKDARFGHGGATFLARPVASCMGTGALDDAHQR